MITIPSLGSLTLTGSGTLGNSELPSKNHVPRNGSVLEMLLGSRDHSNRESREGSTGPPSRQSSTSSLQDGGSSGSQFFEVLYLGKIKSVSHRKAPPMFIDDVLEKFRAHNQLEELKIRQTSLPVRNSSNLFKPIRQLSADEFNFNSHEMRSICGTKLVDTQEEEESNDTQLALMNANNTLAILKQTEVVLQTLSNNMEVQEKTASTLCPLDDTKMRARTTSGSGVPVSTTESNHMAAEVMRDRASSMGSFNRLKRVNSTILLDVPRTGPINENNRTMLLQISRSDVKLISPDRKSVLLSKLFRDISHCSQGVNHPDNFGFICRDANNENNVCYVFKCQNSSVADEIMTVLKLATNSVTQCQKREKGNFCEHCPTIWLQKLILDIEGLSDHKAHGLLLKRIGNLPDTDQQELMAKYKGADLTKTKEQNDLLLSLLKAHCETRQMNHVHDTAENRHEFLSQYFDRGSGAIFQKAKRSLTNSFDQLLKRKSKEDVAPELPFSAVKRVGDISEGTPLRQAFHFDMANGLSQSPLNETPNRKVEINRPRSSTLCSSHGETIKKELMDIKNKRRTSRQDKEESQLETPKETMSPSLKSPIMNIFFKVGNPSHLQVLLPESSVDRTPMPRKVGSWRQAIFQQVKSPNQTSDYNGVDIHKVVDGDSGPLRTRQHYRHLWRKAIKQQILLIRMDKENRRLKAHQEEVAIKRMKLNYDEIVSYPRSVVQLWEKILNGNLPCDYLALAKAVEKGVPKQRRGETWRLLIKTRDSMETIQPSWCRHVIHDDYTLCRETIDYDQFPLLDVPYEELLHQLTSHQHAIIIDLGRTFPNLKFFEASLGPGQLALYNLLKAYSLLDTEVGYCQGLSFIAGVLLLHLDENEAYCMLRYLMLQLGLRRQYLPDMAALQIQLYQMARLLRDLHRDLYRHLEEHEVSPTLYAAPWFLTLFASQFPLGFVVRVFDLIFLSGMSMVFRIGLSLLADHKDMLLQCRNFEQLMDYFKTTLPSMGTSQLERVIHEALELDIDRQLAAYEVEYHVLQEEIVASMSSGPASPKILREEETHKCERLEESNKNLQKQVRELQAQVREAQTSTRLLETNLAASQVMYGRLEQQLHDRETERGLLMQLVTDLVKRLPHGQEIIIPPGLVRSLEELSRQDKDQEGLSMLVTGS